MTVATASLLPADGPDNRISLVSGDSATLEIEIRDECKRAVDLTGATVIFALAVCSGSTVLIAKSTANVGEGSILDGPRGLAEIILLATDTVLATIPLDCELVYEIRVQLAAGGRHTAVRDVMVIETATASF